MSVDRENRLIKAMTLKMEEYGMPVFKDNLPAMDILQLIKDAGYRKPATPELIPLIDKDLMKFYHDWVVKNPDCSMARFCIDVSAKFGQIPQQAVSVKLPTEDVFIHHGCGSHNCAIKTPTGQGHNCGCLCNASTLRMYIQWLKNHSTNAPAQGVSEEDLIVWLRKDAPIKIYPEGINEFACAISKFLKSRGIEVKG